MANKPAAKTYNLNLPQSLYIAVPGLDGVSFGGGFTLNVNSAGNPSITGWNFVVQIGGGTAPIQTPDPPPIDPQLTGFPPDPTYANWPPAPPGFAPTPTPTPAPGDDDDDDFAVRAADVPVAASAVPLTPVTVPNIQIPGLPDGIYLSGSFSADVQAGKPAFSNWAVKLNFAWSGGGSTLIPPPKTS